MKTFAIKPSFMCYTLHCVSQGHLPKLSSKNDSICYQCVMLYVGCCECLWTDS